MIGDIMPDETIIFQLSDDTDKERLLSLINGKYVIIRLKALKTVFCADEEGMKIIFGELGKIFSGSEKFRMERLFISNTIQLDEEDFSFNDIADSMAEAELEQNGCISVEVTDHIVSIRDLPF